MRAYEKGKAINTKPTVDESSRSSVWPNCRDGETLTLAFRRWWEFPDSSPFQSMRH